MRILVTGSAEHVGEALVRHLRGEGHQVAGIEVLASLTSEVGSVEDRSFGRRCVEGKEAAIRAATLHKPHVAMDSRQQFVDTNVTGPLHLLERPAASFGDS